MPIGIIKDIESGSGDSTQLQPGDILIMMTDGIYDAPGYAVNQRVMDETALFKRLIQMIHKNLADCLLESVIRYQQHGDIRDDMTVVVVKSRAFPP